MPLKDPNVIGKFENHAWTSQHCTLSLGGGTKVGGEVAMTHKFLIAIFLCLTGTVAAGCYSSYTTRPHSSYVMGVDSIASEAAVTKKSYFLLSSNKDVPPDDLQFKEYATYLRRALKAQGFVEAPALEKADIEIFLAYGVGDPQQEQLTEGNVPQWGQTGVSASTQGTIYNYGNYGTYSGTTTYRPTYGITGYSTKVETRTIYSSFIIIDAYDLAVFNKEKKLTQLWKTTVINRDPSPDLRRVFPFLVAAAKPYIATNTGSLQIAVIYENDPALLEIKGILPENKETEK